VLGYLVVLVQGAGQAEEAVVQAFQVLLAEAAQVVPVQARVVVPLAFTLLL
jgi:hypothetical protein